MDLQDQINELKKLSKIKNSWYSVAGIAIMIAEAGGDVPRRLRDACDASGFSVSTLKRMMSVRDFADSMKGKNADLQQVSDLNSLSYPNLELAKRLYQVNQEKGLNLLADVLKGENTFRELLAKYNQLVSENIGAASSQQIARFEEREFGVIALAAVKKAVNDICGNLFITIETPQNMPLPVDAVGYGEYDHNRSHPFAGFVFINYREQVNWKQILDSLQHRAIFSSYFFKCFWVIFSENTGQECITAFTNILIELRCESMGVAKIPLNGNSLEIVHRISGDPFADWSNKLDVYRKLRSKLLNSKP